MHDAFAVAAPGLAPLVAAELRALGIRTRRPEAGGVAFAASTDALYAANLWSRTASRVLVRLGAFPATAFHELERRARRLPWARFIAPNSLVHVRATCHKSALYHSDAVAARVMDAITRSTGALAADGSPDADATDDADDRSGDRTDGPAADGAVERSAPLLVVVRIAHDACTVSIDSSGALLHRRGYRLATARAPLRETLAAAMLLASDWTGDGPLLDPLCGSGTIPIEAALIARRRAPGIARAANRAFAFTGWPEFDTARFAVLVERARDGERTGAPPPILASDRDAGATAATAANATRAGVDADIEIRTAALSDATPPPGPGWLVTNPPYGVRVRAAADVRDLYARLGQVARLRCAGWRVALLVADPRLASAVRLPVSPRLRTSNGGIPVTLLEGRVPITAAADARDR